MKKAIVFTALCLLITNGIGRDLSWLINDNSQQVYWTNSPFYQQRVKHGWQPEGEDRALSSPPALVYAGEFGLGIVGAGVSIAGLYYAFFSSSVAYNILDGLGFDAYEVEPFFFSVSYFFTCPPLSAGGVHLGGKLMNYEKKFGHALVGTIIGSALGFAGSAYLAQVLVDDKGRYSRFDVVTFLTPAIILPPICGTVLYNLWM